MITTYQQALDYLYQFIDPARKPAATHSEATEQLQRVAALLERAGSPQNSLRCVVIAGTKGKGSTAAIIEAIARKAGYRTGLWTSPHLNSYRERIQVDRQPMSQAELVAAVQVLQPLVAEHSAEHGRPSTFDLGFLIALRHFVQHEVDLAILEIGLGGRFDSVNVVTPLVSVITSLSLDHTQFLGTTIAEIAWNKAGIMKPAVPAVMAPASPAAREVLLHEATVVGTPLFEATPNCVEGVILSTERRPYPVAAQPRLRGAFQQENARLALATALCLRDQDLQLPTEALTAGLASVEWPGRLEVVASQPTIVLDGAHNGDSAQKLAQALRDEFHFRRLILVLGVSRDKDLDAILAALVPQADALVFTRSIHPRAEADLDTLTMLVQPYLRGELWLTPDIPDALERARELAQAGDVICVTGSLFVVGAAREYFGLAISD